MTKDEIAALARQAAGRIVVDARHYQPEEDGRPGENLAPLIEESAKEVQRVINRALSAGRYQDGRSKFTDEQLVRQWKKFDGSAALVAEALGVNVSTVYVRARTLRRAGVNGMETRSAKIRSIDTARLNEILDAPDA